MSNAELDPNGNSIDLSKIGLVDVDEFNKMLADYKRVKEELKTSQEENERLRGIIEVLKKKESTFDTKETFPDG